MRPLDRELIGAGSSIRTAMAAIDSTGIGIALMVDSNGRMIGTVSDGDVRRALLGGASLADPVDPFVAREPVTVPEGSDRAAVLDLMRARRLSQIPVVRPDGVLIGLHVLQEVLGAETKPNAAVVLAGGRGTRLGKFTAATPKPMLPVAGRPILERIILHLVGSGITDIYVSIAHYGDQIESYFGDGDEFGCRIRYLREDPERPLGTGGPLRLLLDRKDVPEQPLVAMNGDLLTSFSVSRILAAHADSDAAMTIALREYVHDVPFGVTTLDTEGRIRSIEEKPTCTGLINAGIYVIEPRLLTRIPVGVAYPITELAVASIDAGERVQGWELRGEWHDIGRPQEFAKARGERVD